MKSLDRSFCQNANLRLVTIVLLSIDKILERRRLEIFNPCHRVAGNWAIYHLSERFKRCWRSWICLKNFFLWLSKYGSCGLSILIRTSRRKIIELFDLQEVVSSSTVPLCHQIIWANFTTISRAWIDWATRQLACDNLNTLWARFKQLRLDPA